MNYEGMSDFEINKYVSKYIDFGDLVISDNGAEVYLLEKDGLLDYLPVMIFDPCNKPSDAWPVIVENGISLVYMGDLWEAHVIDNYLQDEARNTQDKKPLRAAMICFLKMKDSEEE